MGLIRILVARLMGIKSDDKNFPIVSDSYSRSVEFPNEILLASKDKLDSIVDFVISLKN